MIRPLLLWLALASALSLGPSAAQITGDETVADDVAIQPAAQDAKIAERIASILEATGWFTGAQVTVDDGVVFLDGKTDTEAHRLWARDLAARTEGTVAVVNRLEVAAAPDWSFAPAFAAMRDVAERTVSSLPLIVLTIVILPLTWWLSALAARGIRAVFLARMTSPFLRTVVSRMLTLPIFLLGIYVVLQVAGLTQLALSVVGGAGVIGIVVGFAFRDIAENFLASLLLSIRQPFRVDDFIIVGDMQGTVHSMNTRSTVLISPEGNQIQIPNATVFKSVITNYTASPETRSSIAVGIGYDAPVNEAQRIIAQVLEEHEAILNEPSPMILVDTLGSSTVNVIAYYWVDIRRFSLLKVKSSVLRLVKKSLTEAGISMPDDAREIIFPEGVPLSRDLGVDGPKRVLPPVTESSEESTEAEAELDNEQDEVVERAARSDMPDDDGNLLR